MKVVITIKDGYIYTVGNIMNEAGTVKEVKRATRLYPANPLLKVAFIALRKIFGEKGKVSDWTRRWNCRWELVINGKKIGVFNSRTEALKEELVYVNSILENI